MSRLDELIESHEVIVLVGNGGVGKTTMSSLLAVRAAQKGHRTLVLTVDPAKRLAQALGVDALSGESSAISIEGKGTLFAAVIDAKSIFDRFIRKHVLSVEAQEKILNNRIYQKLTTQLSGSQEFTALDRLLTAHESQQYDRIILDTPPASHAIDFLEEAEKIENIFQDAVLKWFVSPFQRQSWVGQIIHRGTNVAFKGLEKLTGSEFLEELLNFFQTVYVLKDQILKRMSQARQLLQSPKVAFVLVTQADKNKIQAAEALIGTLNKRGYELKHIFVNRTFPHMKLATTMVLAPDAQKTWNQVRGLYQTMEAVNRAHEEALGHLLNRLGSHLGVTKVIDQDQDIDDIRGLEVLSKTLDSKL